MESSAPSPRTQLGRRAERGHFDRESIHAILDEGIYGHLGIVRDGHPVVLPTLHARIDDQLYLHGSPQSRLLQGGREHPVCYTVTLLDALVLARSAFHHSLNFRSVVVYGQARWVDALDEKRRAMERLVEHVVPGRATDCRAPSDPELEGTGVLALELSEASAKVRTGPPVDKASDRELPHWAGVLPLALVAGAAQADEFTPAGIEVPRYLLNYRRGVEHGT